MTLDPTEYPELAVWEWDITAKSQVATEIHALGEEIRATRTPTDATGITVN